MNAHKGLPVNAGTRAVCGASCEDLDSLIRRPATIDYSKAQGLSLQASIYILNTASVNATGAFSFGTGTEVETSAGRNFFGRSLTIFGQDTKSTSAGRNYFEVLPTIFGTGTEVTTSAGR